MTIYTAADYDNGCSGDGVDGGGHYNNQLISAVEEMPEAATAMAAVMAMAAGNSDIANNKLKSAAKETAVAVEVMATATAMATVTVTAGGGGSGNTTGAVATYRTTSRGGGG